MAGNVNGPLGQGHWLMCAVISIVRAGCHGGGNTTAYPEGRYWLAAVASDWL
ncbi:hypothetical protein [Mycobacterium leprae]|uniref:hypothetical protein n=1 Tax=Mycobacterium leprae TaxID=1769 RepID=UPI000312DFDE|nr:hypothetical protein [Mycobacterium leprae]